MATTAKFSSVKEIIENTKLTKKEVALMDLLNEYLSGNFGEDFSSYDSNDLAEGLGWTVKSVVGVVGSLVKKGICETYDTGTGFDVVLFANQAEMKYVELSAEEPEVEVSAEEPKKVAKAVRKVGDMHKNGKWVWTEYKAGKFDWRVAKKEAGVKPASAPIETKVEQPAEEEPEVETKVEEAVEEPEVGTFMDGKSKYKIDPSVLALPEEVVKGAVDLVKGISYYRVLAIDVANESSGAVTIEQFMKDNKVTKTKEASRKRFLKDNVKGYYSGDNEITEEGVAVLVEALGENFGLYNYFNKVGSPTSIKVTNVGRITKQVESRNIYDMMAATQYQVTKVEIGIWKHKGSALLEIYLVKNSTLSMQDINSFM